MARLPKLMARNYNPEIDADGVEANLRYNGYFVEGQDSAERLAGFVGRMPSAVIVATPLSIPHENNIIYGNIYVPDSQYPVIGRISIAKDVIHPQDRVEVLRTLHNKAFDALRERGAPHVELLTDWETPRPELSEAGDAFSRAAGFEPMWDTAILKRPLWDANGEPFPNIPPLS